MISETRFNLSISNSIDRSIDIRSVNGLWDSSSKCLAANPYDHPLAGLTPAPASAISELPRQQASSSEPVRSDTCSYL